MASGRDRLRAAEAALGAGFPTLAVSVAYYAALYAARAALSEEDRHAKTHSGVWALFGEVFVSTGRLAAEPATTVRLLQERREAADYDAREVSAEEAQDAIAVARTFVDAIATMLGA